MIEFLQITSFLSSSIKVLEIISNHANVLLMKKIIKFFQSHLKNPITIR